MAIASLIAFRLARGAVAGGWVCRFVGVGAGAFELLHGLFDKLVYSKLRDAMGGHVQYAVSGGAALGERLGHFFNGIGVTISAVCTCSSRSSRSRNPTTIPTMDGTITTTPLMRSG